MIFVNKKKAFRWFRQHFDMHKTSQNWWAFDNPFDLSGAGKRKMAVHFEYEIVKCWRTDYRERLLTFVSDYLNVSWGEAKAIINDQDEASIEDDALSVTNIAPVRRYGIELPFGYVGLFDTDTTLARRARTYLKARGFDLDQLERMGFGLCEQRHEDSKQDFFGYIIIPFIRAGKLEYYIGRDFIGNFLRYKNPEKAMYGLGKEEVLFNADALFMYDEVYLLEGWADAVTLGENAMSTQGWTFSQKQLDIISRSPVKRVTVVADQGYFKTAVQSAMRLLDVVEEVYAVNIDNYCTGNQKDVNDLGRDKALEAIKNGGVKITLSEGLKLIV